MEREEAIRVLLDPSKSSQIHETLKILEKHPDLLHIPQMGYLRKFLADMETKLPELIRAKETARIANPLPMPQPPDESCYFDPKDPEAIEPEDYPLPPLGPSEVLSLSHADALHLEDIKRRAKCAIESSNNEDALAMLTEAIQHGSVELPSLYAKRAELLLKMRRPTAAVRDATEALKLNSDFASAYRIRGCANRALQNWEQAHIDLAQAQSIDFDEKAEKIQKKVDKVWMRISQERRKYQIALEDRAESENLQRLKIELEKLQEIQDSEAMKLSVNEEREQEARAESEGMYPLHEILGDEFKEALNDPIVCNAAYEISENPAAYMKYESDPILSPILKKVVDKLHRVRGL